MYVLLRVSDPDPHGSAYFCPGRIRIRINLRIRIRKKKCGSETLIGNSNKYTTSINGPKYRELPESNYEKKVTKL